MTTARVDLEYDGARFYGWTRQDGTRTVEGELARAIGVLARQPVELTVAGRTDRGVHALGQVVSYDGPPVSVHALNALLPPDMAVHSCSAVPDGFSARYDATSRSYEYRVLHRRERSALLRGRELWWAHGLDRDLLDACAALLPGTHDFTAFTPTQTKHRLFDRTVTSAGWEADGELLRFRIEARAFLRHMNRVLVGTMIEVAQHRRSFDDFARLLEGAERAEAGPTAPPHGLYLTGVAYDAPS